MVSEGIDMINKVKISVICILIIFIFGCVWFIYLEQTRPKEARLYFYGHNQFEAIVQYLKNQHLLFKLIEDQHVERMDTYFHTINTELPICGSKNVLLIFFNKELASIVINIDGEYSQSIYSNCLNSLLEGSDRKQITIKENNDENGHINRIIIIDEYLENLKKSWIEKFS